jgi:hypothetical protein
MNIYHYIADTGIFYSEGIADESPLEPGVFLIPAYATTFKPPKTTLPNVAVFRNGTWNVEVLPAPSEPEPIPEPVPPEPPAPLTPAEKLAASGLTVEELKTLLGLT